MSHDTQTPDTKPKKRSRLKEALSFDSLVRHMPMVLLLTMLALIYIWNQHSAHRQMMELARIKKELQEYNWEFSTARKELNNRSMQSEVARLVAPMGLRELTTPPYKLSEQDDD